MINLSQIARESNRPLFEKIKDSIAPEVYIASNVADYKFNMISIPKPLFNNIGILDRNVYSLILFYNVGIDCVENKEGEEFAKVKIHDKTGTKIASWSNSNGTFPAERHYTDMLNSDEIKEKDWVYRLLARHVFDEDGSVLFVADVKKTKFTNKKTEKSPLIERINALIPQVNPGLLPQGAH
ncbi:MAG: hypothetical protein AABW51_00175 [Nanoarchaeota archaeon]